MIAWISWYCMNAFMQILRVKFDMFFTQTNGVKRFNSGLIFRYTQQFTMGMVNKVNDFVSRDVINEIHDGSLWYRSLKQSFSNDLNLA